MDKKWEKEKGRGKEDYIKTGTLLGHLISLILLACVRRNLTVCSTTGTDRERPVGKWWQKHWTNIKWWW